MRRREHPPGCWLSQRIGRRDPYERWMPDVAVVCHQIPRSALCKQRFREFCRQRTDRYGMYYDVIGEDDRRHSTPYWGTVFKLYGPSAHKGQLMDDLLPLLETTATKGSPTWVARWKKKMRAIKKRLYQR